MLLLPPLLFAGFGDEDHDDSLFLRRDGEKTGARIKLAFSNRECEEEKRFLFCFWDEMDGWIPAAAAARGKDPTPLWGLWREGSSTPIESARRLFSRFRNRGLACSAVWETGSQSVSCYRHGVVSSVL